TEIPDRACYMTGYACYEFYFDHHDELSDLFSLGLVLASMAKGLNLYDPHDLRLFVENRHSPVSFRNRIHPLISGLITQMTELNPKDRPADLYEIIERLENYREFDPERLQDLGMVFEQKQKEKASRELFILSKLRN